MALVSIILPHRESWSREAAGAVATVVHGLAGGGARHPARVYGPPPQGAPLPGVPFTAVRAPAWLPLGSKQRYALAVARLLRAQPPGLVEVHNKPAIALWLARLLPRSRVSLFLHNDPQTMPGADSPAARLRLCRRLAGIVTISDFLRGRFEAGLEGQGAAQLLHNALDIAALPPPLPPAEREPLILFAGRLVPEKAPDAFIAACARALPQLPGWRAEAIGSLGFGQARAAVSPFIRQLQAAAPAAGVALPGHQPRAAVLDAMARAAIVVVPSRWQEPFAMTALEAMASGAALVSSGRGGLAEVAGEACVTIDPEDPAGMAAALLALARAPERRAALAEAGRQRARELFDRPRAIARLDALRDAVLAAAPP